MQIYSSTVTTGKPFWIMMRQEMEGGTGSNRNSNMCKAPVTSPPPISSTHKQVSKLILHLKIWGFKTGYRLQDREVSVLVWLLISVTLLESVGDNSLVVLEYCCYIMAFSAQTDYIVP